MKTLPYVQTREAIRDGDMLLWKGETFVSRGIRAVTESEYSHVSIARWDTGRLMHFEAVWHGTAYNPLSGSVKSYGSATVDVYRLRSTTGVEMHKVFQVALGLLNRPYDYRQIRRILIKTLFGSVVRDTRGELRKLICSEYASYCYRFAGVDLAKALDDGYTAPADIAESPRLGRVLSFSWEGER